MYLLRSLEIPVQRSTPTNREYFQLKGGLQQLLCILHRPINICIQEMTWDWIPKCYVSLKGHKYKNTGFCRTWKVLPGVVLAFWKCLFSIDDKDVRVFIGFVCQELPHERSLKYQLDTRVSLILQVMLPTFVQHMLSHLAASPQQWSDTCSGRNCISTHLRFACAIHCASPSSNLEETV